MSDKNMEEKKAPETTLTIKIHIEGIEELFEQLAGIEEMLQEVSDSMKDLYYKYY